MSIDHIIDRICNSKSEEIILIGDNTTLLDYRHTMYGRIQTQAMLVAIT